MTCYSHEEKLVALTSETFTIFIKRYLSEIGDPPNDTRMYNLWKVRKDANWKEKEELRGE